MIAPRPFFLLLGRASVFWLSAIGSVALSVTVLGLSQPDGRSGPHVDAVFMFAFALPAMAGWLAGTVVQEFQHTTFAAALPDVRPRIASGFLAAGLAVTVVVVGVLTALFGSVALGDARAYPISRRQRARVHFRGNLVDGAILLFVMGPCLYAIGHSTGWIAGHEIRFDFMPFFFRALMVTLILLPLAYLGRLRLQAATRRRAENTLVGLIFGICGFVAAVGVGMLILPLIFDSPAAELAALVVALLVSQWIHRRKLGSYYRTADLA